eukprot:GHVR01181747.1.p1 GENE.GHVR01181747.1~~GHVR01181747.1.p1  ORF type:complete len:259 (+),score=33.97 GHVR01181747.1:498-1274(+)
MGVAFKKHENVKYDCALGLNPLYKEPEELCTDSHCSLYRAPYNVLIRFDNNVPKLSFPTSIPSEQFPFFELVHEFFYESFLVPLNSRNHTVKIHNEEAVVCDECYIQIDMLRYVTMVPWNIVSKYILKDLLHNEMISEEDTHTLKKMLLECHGNTELTHDKIRISVLDKIRINVLTHQDVELFNLFLFKKSDDDANVRHMNFCAYENDNDDDDTTSIIYMSPMMVFSNPAHMVFIPAARGSETALVKIYKGKTTDSLE